MAVLAAALLISCGVSQAPPTPASETPGTAVAIVVRVAPAITGGITVTTSYPAIIRAKDEVDVVPLTTGRIGTIEVDVGAEVRKGQVMAKLSRATIDIQLQQAQANLAAAEANFDQLLNLSESDLQVGESEVSKAQSNLDTTKIQLTQLLNPSPSDLQAARSAMVKAQSNLSSAKTQLDQLLNPSAADLQVAESGVSKARSSLDSAKTQLEILSNPTNVQLAVTQESLAAARSRLSRAQLATNRAIIAAGSKGNWRLLLDVRTSLQNLVVIHLNQALDQETDSSVAVEILRLEEIISTLLGQLGAESPFPEDIRVALWSEAEAQRSIDTALAELEELQNPSQERINLARNLIARNHADLIAAVASLEELQAPNADKITLATNAVDAAQASVDAANAALKELQNPTQTSIDRAQNTVDAAQATLNAAVAKFNHLTNPRVGDSATPDNGRATAEQLLELNEGPLVRHAIEAAQAEKDQAQASVDQVKQRLGELQVLAPFDGFVAERWLGPGAVTSPSTAIFTVTSKEVVVSSRIEDAGAESYREGQLLQFTSPGFPPKILELKIDQIAPAGDLKPNTFSARMSVVGEIPELDLRPGMSGQISISVRRDIVVLVPMEAVIRQGNQLTLFVVEGGIAHLVKVDGGLADGKNMEILSGVSPGDQVVVSGMNLLSEGVLVTIS